MGLRTTVDTMVLARNEILSWVYGGARPQVAGPVAIAQTTGEVARSSETTAGAISPLLELAAHPFAPGHGKAALAGRATRALREGGFSKTAD